MQGKEEDAHTPAGTQAHTQHRERENYPHRQRDWQVAQWLSMLAKPCQNSKLCMWVWERRRARERETDRQRKREREDTREQKREKGGSRGGLERNRETERRMTGWFIQRVRSGVNQTLMALGVQYVSLSLQSFLSLTESLPCHPLSLQQAPTISLRNQTSKPFSINVHMVKLRFGI